jgi:type I restriction enzyme S subunit
MTSSVASAQGSVPEGWAVVALVELLCDGPTNGYSGRSGKDAYGTPTLTLGATSSGSLILNATTTKRLYETVDPESDLFLRPGDVLVQRSNTIDLVGTTAVFHGPVGQYVYPDLMMRLRFRRDDVALWFWRYANSAHGRRYFASVAAGSSGSMPKLSGDKLRQMPVPLPTVGERRAITKALDDVDALLDGLTRFIAKKRDLKQAALQQLLSGRARLPGFSGAWATALFGDVAVIRNEKVIPSSVDSDLACIELEHIEHANGRLLELSTAASSTSAKYRFFQGDVLFGRLRPYLRKYWLADRVGLCSTEIWPLVARHGVATASFLFALVQTDRFIESASASYGTHMPRADWGVTRKLEIRLPALDEQTAIAAVLSDMDAELAALEARRGKTQALKQAMMQALLTGRIRLVSPEPAHA